jgi:manganese transport protein
MEIAAMATDLAEFLGAAIGFQLLLGIPLLCAAFLTAAATFLILSLERFGFRPLELVISGFVGVIAVSYLVETILDRPPLGQVLFHTFVPQLQGPESVLLAVGILGATVMPHAIFLHSSLMQNRIVVKEPGKLRRLLRFEIADVSIAMGIAGLINMAMLIMAAATFFAKGLTTIGTLEEAHKTLEPLLGRAASWVFGVSLLASGLSSSSVGTMAGQVIMQGFVRRRIPAWIRRLATMVPSLVVISLGVDPTRTLVLSQVVLSFGLPFAVIPLVMFTQRKDIMGVLVNRPFTNVLAWLAAGLIVVLNVYLILQTFTGG